MSDILKSYPEIDQVLKEKRRKEVDYEPLRVTEGRDIKLCSPKQEANFYKEQLEIVTAERDENTRIQKDGLDIEAAAEFDVDTRAVLKVESTVEVDSEIEKMKARLASLEQQAAPQQQETPKKPSSFFSTPKRLLSRNSKTASDAYVPEGKNETTIKSSM